MQFSHGTGASGEEDRGSGRVHIPHNTIYKILARNDLIEEKIKKKRQRK
jgi:hypothetical protein